MPKKTSTFDYQAKALELETLLTDLQNPNIQIDAATKLHTKGIALTKELEIYLQQAELEVRKHISEE